jgi:hypothetical protein
MKLKSSIVALILLTVGLLSMNEKAIAARWIRNGICYGIGVRMCLVDNNFNIIQCICVPGRL